MNITINNEVIFVISSKTTSHSNRRTLRRLLNSICNEIDRFKRIMIVTQSINNSVF